MGAIAPPYGLKKIFFSHYFYCSLLKKVNFLSYNTDEVTYFICRIHVLILWQIRLYTADAV